jgi:hypothetical protein
VAASGRRGDRSLTAFLNPLAFAASGPTTPEQAAGVIVCGLTRQVGNEMDEFVTEAVHNNLLGLPLDLAALNITRGRATGIPPLNQAHREFYAMTGHSQLLPYTNWADFVQHLRHPESLANFITAYGTHGTITNAMTLADKRATAAAIVFGSPGATADSLAFQKQHECLDEQFERRDDHRSRQRRFLDRRYG